MATLSTQVTRPTQGVGVRGAVAGLLVVVGLLVTPVAVVAAHARPQLTDTERFVATFGPLASDRGVQDAVADAAIAGVDATVDFSSLAGAAVSGLLDQMSLPSLVGSAVQSLGDRAASAVRSVVDEQIRSLVTSDAFPRIWEGMLRQAHSRALAGVQGDASASLVVRGDTVVLQVGPVVDRARQALVDRGVRFASLIPAVDRTVDLVEVPGLSAAVTGHGAAAAAGIWLPLVAAVLVAVGVALARRRRRAVLWTGLGLAGIAVVTLVGLALARTTLGAAAHDEAAGPLDRSRALLRVAAYDAVTGGVLRTTAILLVTGVIAAVAAYAVGRVGVPPAAPPQPTGTSRSAI